VDISSLPVFTDNDKSLVLTPAGLALLVYCLLASRTDFNEGDVDATDALFALVEDELVS